MLGSSRYMFLVKLGGFLWWVLIRFGKTKLSEEQLEEKKERNIFFLFITIFVFSIIKIKFFE
jgi:hypothetical protein